MEEKLAREAFELLGDAVVEVGDGGEIEWVNASGADMFRCAPEALLGIGVERLIRFESAQPGVHALDRAHGERRGAYQASDGIWRGAWIRVAGADGSRILVVRADTVASAANHVVTDAFREFFQNAPIGKSMTGPDGRLLHVNEAFAHMLGRSVGEMHALRLEDITHPDDLSRSAEGVRRLAAGELDSWEIEKRYLHRNGRCVWTHVHTRVQRDKSGEPCFFLTHVINITERVRRRALLRTRASLTEYAADHSLQATLTKAIDEAEALTESSIGFYHFVDPGEKTLTLQAWSTRTKQEVCEAQGSGLHYGIDEAGVWVDCVHERRPVVHNDYASLPHKKGVPEGHAAVVREVLVPVLRSGVIVAILGVGNKPIDYDDDDVESLSLLADVTWEIVERKRAQDAAEASTAQMRTLSIAVEQSPASVMITDPAGRIEYVNARFTQITGYGSAEVVGNNPRILKSGQVPSAIYTDLWATISSGSVWKGELLNKKKNGEVYREHAAISPVKDSAGRATHYVAIKEDVTERRRLEGLVAESDRLASLGLLAAGVAHEINNPLTFVLYNVQVAEEDLDALGAALGRYRDTLATSLTDQDILRVLGEGQVFFTRGGLSDLKQKLRDALSGLQQIRAVTQSLGTLARVDDARAAPVQLASAIEAAGAMAFHEIKYKARLVKDYSPVPAVVAPEGKLAQVFLNLLVNAAHAIDEGAVAANEIRVSTRAEGRWVVTEVSDTGSGIAPEALARLFEPFFTTKPRGKGTGLGLPICKRIVSELGGDIAVATLLGKGTKVTVRLPAADAAPLQPLPVSIPAPGVPRGRILIVDDEPYIHTMMKRMLGDRHDVVFASSGQEATAILQQDESFDLILADVMMAQKSGIELHRWLTERNADLAGQVVFMSGGAFSPATVDYLRRVDNVKLDKPIDRAGCRRLVDEMVRSHRAGKGQPR